jgi:hypothetical protein
MSMFRQRALQRGADLFLVGSVVVLLAIAASMWAANPVSFDGGINLQVAKNLADGEGYTRDYQGVRLFPTEVESKVPFLLPASGIFALFGVTLLTAQLTNILYLILFAAALLWFLGRSIGWGWGSFAALAAIAAPGLMAYGGYGYGELVALFWWLLGTLILFSGPLPPTSQRLFLAGICLGLSLATKTVLAIGVGSTGLVLCIYLVSSEGLSWKTLRSLLVVGAGFIFPLALFEGWHWSVLGGSAAYIEWWRLQVLEIGKQAGVVAGYDDTQGVWAKGAAHFEILANYVHLSQPLTAVWLLFPLLACSLYVFSPRRELKWLVLSILLCAVVYLAWWLFVTPTMKAWPRRIFNGVLLINLLWVFACYAGNALPVFGRRAAAALSALSILAACAFFVHSALHGFWWTRPSQTTEFKQAVQALKQLPSSAPIFGNGWYSAPTLALYSGRTVTDIATIPPAELEKQGTGYLAMDAPAMSAKAFDDYLGRFKHRAVFNGRWFQVHEVDFGSRQDWAEPLRNPGDGLKHDIDLNKESYAAATGLFPDDWTTMDTEFLLAPTKAAEVQVDVYRPAGVYFYDRPLTITAYLEGCDLGSEVIPADDPKTLRFKVPESCAIDEAQPLVLRLISDNVTRGDPWGIDSRQLSYILTRVALVPR